jgi:dTDP-4-amino-4,6-dideoxygalactose transaminase
MLATDQPVPFFDWGSLYADQADRYAAILQETAAAGQFILHHAVTEFEQALADYLGVRHAIALSDCTNAMLLGLRASGLRAGGEVVLPGHAFIAAAQAIHHAGGRPVPVDMDEGGRHVDPAAIRVAITPRTRALMMVHVSGTVCDMDAVEAIAARHGLPIVEDAAQALGASFGETMAGRFGQWAAFSFYPSKTLGCFGDAGALVTDDDVIAELVRAMRNHGAGPDKVIREDCAVWGTNSRMDNLQAAVLVDKIAWYNRAIARRREIAAKYHEGLSDIEGLELPPAPGADPRRFDIFQNYDVCCDERDALRAHLAAQGIGSILHWGGLGVHRFGKLGLGGSLPNTDRFLDRALLLPMNHLLRDDQVARAIAAVRSFFR